MVHPSTPESAGARPATLEIRVVDEVAFTRVSVSGELDLATVPTLSAALRGPLADPFNDIRLDLSDVTFIDSTGLTAVLEARATWLAAGTTFVIERQSQAVDRLVRLLKSVGPTTVAKEGLTK